jgi:hypothetical protein
VRRLRPALLAVTVLSLVACSKPASPSAPPAASAPGGPANPVLEAVTYAPSLQVDLNASTKSASGLYYRDMVVGTGPVAAAGQQVSVNYVGSFINGTQFEANPFSFQLGARLVIPGWDEGVIGMRVGGKRQLIIPPDLAYGPNGSGKIPPNTVLVFTVELVGVK